jgi:single-stranded-DNA-specific exonuclease
MENRWSAKPLPNLEIVARLSQEINVSQHIASILVQREIDTFEKAKQFFRPSLADLHDPFLMKDMDIAYSRIKTALQNQEKMMAQQR